MEKDLAKDLEIDLCDRFCDRFGNLTVGEAQQLNDAAKWYCEHEVTSQTGEED